MADDQVLPPKIWAGADSAKIPISLETDKFIVARFNSRRHPKFVYAMRYVQVVTRRAMEAGFYEALRVRKEKPGPITKDLGKLEAVWGNVASALDVAIKYTEPSATCAADLELSIISIQAGIHEESSAQCLHFKASAYAQSFWDAREKSRMLKDSAWKKSGRMVMKGYKIARKSDRTAFLRVMAEAWIYLTRRKPGTCLDSSGNPFLKFVEEAWKDVFKS